MQDSSGFSKRQQQSLGFGMQIGQAKHQLNQGMVDRSPEIGALEGFQGLVGGPRKSKGQSLLLGFAEGMKYGQRAQEREEKKTAAQKTQQWLEHLEGVNTQLFQDIEREKQKHQVMNEQVYPALEGYLSYMAGNLETGEQPTVDQLQPVARDQFNKLKSAGVIQGDFSGVDNLNPSIILYRGIDGELKQVDVYGMLPDDIKKSNPQFNPMKRVELHHERQRIENQSRGMDLRESGQEFDQRVKDDKTYSQTGQKLDELNTEITGAQDFGNLIDTVSAIIERNPSVINSYAGMTYADLKEPTTWDKISKDILNQFDPETAKDAAMLAKLLSDYALGKMKTLPAGTRMNEFLERLIKKGSLDVNSHVGALKELIKKDKIKNDTLLNKLQNSYQYYESTPGYQRVLQNIKQSPQTKMKKDDVSSTQDGGEVDNKLVEDELASMGL